MLHGQVETQKLLKQVSRSFFLTLRVLPRSIRNPISLAYLLARASDTIADTKLIAVSRRLEALLQLRKSTWEACDGGTFAVPHFGDLAEVQEIVTGEGTTGERLLLENLEQLLKTLRESNPEDRFRIGKALTTIMTGQETDLLRFDAKANGIVALRTGDELDAYTYSVAGCVGEFWTDMCRAHVFPTATLDDVSLRANGVRFGKGLQLINILRDLPKDLRGGRCYIPADRLGIYGLKPEDLLDPSAMGRFRPLFDTYLQLACDHLSAGWQYTISLPFRFVRIRLACAWPILIGIKTLDQLRSGNVLDDRVRIKVGRAEIRGLILQSIVLYPFPAAWNRLSSS